MALHAGIEIDGPDVSIAVVEATSKQTVIIDYIEGKIVGDNSEERLVSLRAILRSALDSHGSKTIDVVSSIPTRMSTLREISVPFTNDDVISKTIRYESEGHLPSASIDDLVIEYIKCSETEDSSRLLISAVQKQLVGAHLEMLREGGVDPVQIEIDATALATSLHVARPDLRGGRTLLIGMEAGHTTFVLLEEGRVTKIRSTSNHLQRSAIPTLTTASTGSAGATASGSDSAQSETAMEFADLMQGGGVAAETAAEDELAIAVVSDEEFERLNAELSSSPTLPPADPDEVIGRLFTEIERTFAGILMRSPLDRIVVAGGAACELGIADRLAEEYEVPAQQLRVCDGIETGLPLDLVDRCNLSGGVAVGLALQSAGQGLVRFDLRKEEHRYERRFSKLLPGLMLMGLILCFMSVTWLIDSHRGKQLRRAEFETVRANERDVFMARFGEAPKGSSPVFVRSAELKIAELKGGTGANKRARLVQYLPGMDLIKDVTGGISAANPKVYPTWKSIEINSAKKRGGTSTVIFEVPDAAAGERVITALEQKSKYFNIEDDIKPAGDRKKVTLKLKLKESITGTGGRN
ncbi:MAG: hypothetical protein OSB09_00080 [Planctomycetota bacterium]|nr:hypothetical protein [Planctomycetota bacterium]